MLEAKLKAEGIIELSNYTSIIISDGKRINLEYYRNQELKKHMNQIEKTSLFEHYDEKPQKFGCYESDALCSCQKKFLKKKKI